MSLKNFRLESKLVPNYRIKKDDYYLLYVLENNLMLKKYLLNDEYLKMLEKRKSDYLEYLRDLMNNTSDFIVKPIDIYAKHSLVTSYTYLKDSGTSISDMYPKTRLDKLIEAMREFYDNLGDLSGFDLSKIKPRDIIYTGTIKVSGLDEGEYSHEDVDRSLISDLLFRGIFNIDMNDEVIINDDNIRSLYDSLTMNKIDMIDFLNEYIHFIKNEYGNCKYVKHLSHKIINKNS